MKTKELERSGLQAPLLGVGAMTWGDPSAIPRFSPARLAYGLVGSRDDQREALEASITEGASLVAGARAPCGNRKALWQDTWPGGASVAHRTGSAAHPRRAQQGSGAAQRGGALLRPDEGRSGRAGPRNGCMEGIGEHDGWTRCGDDPRECGQAVAVGHAEAATRQCFVWHANMSIFLSLNVGRFINHEDRRRF